MENQVYITNISKNTLKIHNLLFTLVGNLKNILQLILLRKMLYYNKPPLP